MRDKTQARRKALQELPRIGTSPIRDNTQFIYYLEDLALTLGSDLLKSKQNLDPDWWQIQDMLDDVLDMIDYVKKNLNSKYK